MKVATNALASLLIIAMLTLSTVTAGAVPAESDTRQRGERKLERIYKHHDRKLELRASVLGMSTDELRTELRAKPFDTIIRQHGFKSREAFHTAVIGKAKDELKRRGWSDQKIERVLQKRFDRLGKLFPNRTRA